MLFNHLNVKKMTGGDLLLASFGTKNVAWLAKLTSTYEFSWFS